MTLVNPEPPYPVLDAGCMETTWILDFLPGRTLFAMGRGNTSMWHLEATRTRVPYVRALRNPDAPFPDPRLARSPDLLTRDPQDLLAPYISNTARSIDNSGYDVSQPIDVLTILEET